MVIIKNNSTGINGNPSSSAKISPLERELVEVLGARVIVSGPSSPTYGSAIKVYTIRKDGVYNRIIVRDYRKDKELSERGVEIVGDIDGREDAIRKVLMNYLG